MLFSIPLDIFIRLPSLKAYFPIAYFIKKISFSSLQTKFGSLHKEMESVRGAQCEPLRPRQEAPSHTRSDRTFNPPLVNPLPGKYL